MYFLTDYLIAMISSIIIALALKLPLLPSKPYRFSFDVSALFPTPIIAIGILSFLFVLNYNGFILAILTGVFSGFFVKYLFYYVFPKPLKEDSYE